MAGYSLKFCRPTPTCYKLNTDRFKNRLIHVYGGQVTDTLSVIDDYPPNSHLFLHDSSSLDTQEVQLNFLIFVTLSI